jgi:hypothetical protein
MKIIDCFTLLILVFCLTACSQKQKSKPIEDDRAVDEETEYRLPFTKLHPRDDAVLRNIPPSIQRLVPFGSEIRALIYGNLNRDPYQDAIILLFVEKITRKIMSVSINMSRNMWLTFLLKSMNRKSECDSNLSEETKKMETVK